MKPCRMTVITLLLALPLTDRTQSAPARMATPLVVGSVAPAFKGKDAAGRPVELKQLLKKGRRVSVRRVAAAL